MKNSLIFTFFLILTVLALLVTISVGSVHLSFSELIKALFSQSPSIAHSILWKLRIPQALTAFCVGGLLALCGSLMQILLRNPLADPYVLGISSAATCGVLLGILWRCNTFTTQIFGWAAALMALGFLLLCNRRNWHSPRLLLCGVILASGLSALISFILSMGAPRQIQVMLFWLLGQINQTQIPVTALILLAISLLIVFCLAKPLNILMRGHQQAKSLGVNTNYLYYFLLLLTAILTTTATLLAGPIGFIGLIIPNLLRLCGLNNHQILLPSAVLLGGSFLCLANALAHIILAPEQLPVGVITALIGAPIFLFLLLRNSR